MADKEQEIDPVKVVEEANKQAELMRALALKLLPVEARQAVEAAKANGVQPYVIQLGDQFFVYRTIGRQEYRQLLLSQAEQAKSLMEQAPDETVGRIQINLRNEDELVIRCCLWPVIDQLNVKTLPAGYIETLHNTVMATSGFNQEPIPIKL